MKVSSLMKTNPKTIPSHESIIEAAKIMKTADIGVLPVVDNGKLVGMITDRDLTLRVIANDKNYKECKVKDVMSTDLKTCHEEEDASSALHLLGKCKLHRLPIVNASNKLVGVVSLCDFARSKDKDSTLLARTLQEIVS